MTGFEVRKPATTRVPVMSASADPLVYNQSCEDLEIDLHVLQPLPGMRILTIASGGCHVVALAQTGADVAAVDTKACQVALTEIKVEAARQLAGRQFLEVFRSGIDAQGSIDALGLSPQTLGLLARRRWFAGAGLYSTSRMGRASRLLRGWIRISGAGPAIEEIFAASSVDEQRTAWGRAWQRLNTWPGRAVLRSRWPLVVAGVPSRVAVQVPGRANTVARGIGHALTTLPAADNWFLQMLFLGEYRTALPPYLRSPEQRMGTVELVTSDLEAFLARTDGEFDAAMLLDCLHWIPARRRGRVWESLHRVLRPGARVTTRTLGPGTEAPASLFAPLRQERFDRTGCYLEAKAYERV